MTVRVSSPRQTGVFAVVSLILILAPIDLHARVLGFDRSEVERRLGAAPQVEHGFEGASSLLLPNPDGELVEFTIVERLTLSPALQSARPHLRTFTGIRVGDEKTQLRLTQSHLGIQARIFGDGGWSLDSTVSTRRDEISAWPNVDDPGVDEFRCLVEEFSKEPRQLPMASKAASKQGSVLRIYDFAMSATGEFTQFHGSIANAEAQITNLINLANAIFERDLAIRMSIVDLNVYDDPATDPFSTGTVINTTALNENHDDLIAKLGSDGFDIGHLVSRLGEPGWSGLAFVGSQCDGSLQGRGGTFAASPSSFTLLEGVLHEIGHQLGASHSFNGTTGACEGNRSPFWAYEIASGVSIMSYAGICGVEDVTRPGYLMYNGGSIEAIANRIAVSASCGATEATGNNPPIADAGPDFTIPLSTAFFLDGSGSSDLDPEVLTFSWEQHDLGPASPPYGPLEGPLMQNHEQESNPVRWIPQYQAYLNGANTPFEILPTVDRTLTFRLIVRDNRSGSGGLAWDTAIITAAGSPFAVLSPDGGESFAAGTPLPVSWQVGGGSVAAAVRILYSSDSGASWTELEPNTPNDGSHLLTTPCDPTSEARIKIEPIDNIFFDVSGSNFSVTPDVEAPVLTCPDPISVVATSETGIEPDDPALSAWIASAQATDNCDSNPVVTFATTQTIPIGVNTVGFVARDASNNLDICTTELTVTPATAVSSLPQRTELLGAYPNPFNPRTTIRFQLRRAQPVRLEILDVRGRRIATIHDSALGEGLHQLEWNGSGGASGVYFARLVTEEGSFHQRLALIK